MKLNSPLPLLFGLLAGGAMLIGTATYLVVESPNKKAEVETLTVPAEQEDLTVEIQASGTVEPILSVNISPTEPGLLLDLRVEQGAQVKQGQVLAIMENNEIRAQGVEAEAELRQAIANLKAAETQIPAEVNQAQAQLIQAQARLFEAQQRLPLDIEQTQTQLAYAKERLELANQQVERYYSLLDDGAITKDRYDEALDNRNNAQSNFNETQQRLEQEQRTAPGSIGELRAAVDEAQLLVNQRKQNAQNEIDQLKATVEAAEARRQRLLVQFSKTVIKAPFDGIITQRYATPGAFVTPTTSASSTASATSSSIVAIARGLEVIAKVPEIDLGQLKPGQPVKIEADAYPGETFQGQVIRVAPEAIVENDVTSFEVAIALANNGGKLLSKMNVEVTFVGPKVANAVVVPTVAIVTEGGQTGVMVPDINNQPIFKPVTIGLTVDDKTQILDGLLPNERVYIDLPEDFLKEQKQAS